MASNHRPKTFKKRLTISLKHKQRRQLKKIAASKDSSIAYVVRDAVETYIRTNGRRAKELAV